MTRPKQQPAKQAAAVCPGSGQSVGRDQRFMDCPVCGAEWLPIRDRRVPEHPWPATVTRQGAAAATREGLCAGSKMLLGEPLDRWTCPLCGAKLHMERRTRWAPNHPPGRSFRQPRRRTSQRRWPDLDAAMRAALQRQRIITEPIGPDDRARSESIRTVSGGLPTLGRGHR